MNVTHDHALPSVAQEDLWRSLLYFNQYRLVLTGFFVFLAITFGAELTLGARNWRLFLDVSELYAAVVLFSFIPLWLRRPRLSWQMAIQVGGDIAGLTMLSYASGGIQSNIGLLLLVSLAAAGMINRGKVTLFYAALASITALLEHSYAVLYDEAEVALYVQVALLCVSYFAVAWLAHTLAKYAVESQQLAQRRARELASLAEANRLVMRDMQDGVLVVDDSGMIMQMNPAAARLLRKSVSAGSALSENFPVLFGPYAVWKQSGSTLRDILQLGDGMQAKLRFVSNDGGDAQGVVIFIEDMQRVQAEAQQIKLAALGRLTANIAHEVRNPLSAISYATELMQEEMVDVRSQRMLKIVLDNTQRINRIVQDVMQINRRDRAQPEMFELDAMLKAFMDEFEKAERLESGVLTRLGGERVKVTFDRGHLRQILWNLCRNALRHGSGSVGSVRLEVREDMRRVVLDVLDDGSGVSVEQRNKLFEPFFTTASDGTGLGLYIAKELCDANGAKLEYRSDKTGSGACFRITFAYSLVLGTESGHGE